MLGLLFFTARICAQDRVLGEEPFGEDPERRIKGWLASPSPDVYLRSLQTSGMLKSKENETRGGSSFDEWVSFGPNGSYGGRNGRIASIQLRSSGPGFIVYVGASNGGLWRANGVPNWTSIGDRLPNLSVRAFAVNPGNPDDIIVGTGDYLRTAKGAGMFRTLNAGLSWTAVPVPGGTPDAFYRLLYVPGNPSNIVGASSTGIIQSLDGGTTWSQRYAGHVTDLVIHPTIPTIQYACAINVGVIRSLNGGTTWNLFNAITTPFSRASLAICRDFQETMAMVVVNNSSGLQGVFRTDDGGNNWTNITSDLGNFGAGQFDHTCSIAIRPNNPSEIYIGAITVARTVNGGTSWQSDPFPVGHADITQLHFSDVTGPNILWITNDGGVYRHTLGGNTDEWNGAAGSVNGLNCSEIDFMDAKREFRTVGLQDNGILRSTNYGTTWEDMRTGDGFGTTITDDRGYEFWFTDGKWPSPVVLQTWKQPLNGPAIRIGNNTMSNQYQFWYNKFDQKVYSAVNNQLLTANAFDASPTWVNSFTLPISDVHLTYGSPLDGNTLYITNDGAIAPTLMILRRNGGSWTATTQTLPGNGRVRAVYVSTEFLGEAWAGLLRPDNEPASSPLVYHTVDFGQTWADITDSTMRGPGYVRTIAVKPLNTQDIYVGTRIGVFRTTNGGANWAPFQTGMPLVTVGDLRYVMDPLHSGTDYLVASTYGRGVWKRDVTLSPLSYVDVNATGFSDGTFDYPFQTFNAGITGTPPGGTVALRGNTYVIGSRTFTTPMIMKAYAGPATIK